MDLVRLARGVRALRRRRRLRQVDLGRLAVVSRGTIARVELGQADRVTLRTLHRVAEALGARLVVRLDWNGEALDRLLDAGHASLVEEIVRILRALGWEARTEVSFNVDGERGSVDVLAWHPSAACLVVVEAKTVVPDVQAMLVTLDRKARLGARIAAMQGWRLAGVGRLLVIREDRTSRRRVSAHAALFEAALPDRARDVRRWLAAPSAAVPLRGLWFLSDARHGDTRHRVSGRRPELTLNRRRRS